NNDITLWPGESETLTATYNSADLSGATPVVSVSGWNTPKVDVIAGSGVPTNDFSVLVSPGSGSVAAGQSVTATVSTVVTSGSAQSVSLSASGLRAGAGVSSNPTSVTAGGSSTMTITTSTSTPAGTYPVTVTGTAASGTHTTVFSLTVTTNGGGGNPIVNGGFETGDYTGWTRSGTTSIVTAPAHTGTRAAMLG